MCWFMVGADGSLYLNPRTTHPKAFQHAQGISDGLGGHISIEWAPPDPSGNGTNKLSYHASGRVKGGVNMTDSVSIRDIAGSTLIRQDEYAHPSRFQVINQSLMKQTDLIIPGPDSNIFELDDDHRLSGRVFVAPLRAGNAQVAMIEDDPNIRSGQTAVLIPVMNLRGCQDLTFQLQFYARTGPWPQRSTIAVLNRDAAAK